MRTIILHYHLFKNAGTSLDRLLQDNFADRWVTREFPSQNNTAKVTDWIKETPEAVAYSSHTMMGPLPRVPGVKIVSVMLLRDPLSRLRSAYTFERQQDAQTFGAVLAKHTTFEGYVRTRLSQPHDRQCRNFQTWRLAGLLPGGAPELERAKQALDLLTVVGQVNQFDDAVAQLKDAIAPDFPDFKAAAVRANVSKASAGKAKAVESDDFANLMVQANSDDLEIMKHLKARTTG